MKICAPTSLRKFIVFLKWSETAGTHPCVNINNPAMVSGRVGSALLPKLRSLNLLWFLWFSSSATLQLFELIFPIWRDVLNSSWLHPPSGRVSAGHWNAVFDLCEDPWAWGSKDVAGAFSGSSENLWHLLVLQDQEGKLKWLPWLKQRQH